MLLLLKLYHRRRRRRRRHHHHLIHLFIIRMFFLHSAHNMGWFMEGTSLSLFYSESHNRQRHDQQQSALQVSEFTPRTSTYDLTSSDFQIRTIDRYLAMTYILLREVFGTSDCKMSRSRRSWFETNSGTEQEWRTPNSQRLLCSHKFYVRSLC